ncbi:MAG: DUF3857 domain-containing protein [Arenimonas sp.]|nr:DUF3857 domain-containing protein [Arenimonas sp.]
MAAALPLIFVLLCTGLPVASAAEYRIGPTPGWVTRLELDTDAPTPSDQVSGGVYYLLSDSQYLGAPGAPTFYSRYATRATQTEGLESVAHITIDFDPTFQALTLHAVDVVRDGKRIGRLDTTQVRVIQRESERDLRIYDGRKTATLFLDDVRVGDIVDYAYSVVGRNPAFGDVHFGGATLQWDVPVRLDHTRTLVPAGTPLQVLSLNGAPEPVRSRVGNYDQYVWLQRHVVALGNEDDAPAWFNRHAGVEWSQYAAWSDVAGWALPLYAPPAQLGAALDAEIARIAAEHATPAARTAAVLRFAQSQVRYLAVQVGVGSFRPNPPRTVLERRFGDCKDKTLLMLSMLQRLGVDAHAALVNTESGQSLHERLPAPNLFDHVLVRVLIDGQAYWLDPTRETQFGQLDKVHQPDYGHALVVAAGTTALLPMRSPDRAVPRRRIHVVIDASAGMDADARMTVTTTSTDHDAEGARSRLASKPIDQVSEEFRNYYANYYPRIRQDGPMAVDDDREANRIVTRESYVIEGFWDKDEATGEREAVAHAADMFDALPGLSTPNRQTPLARPHPVDFTLTTELKLHDPWSLDESRETIRHRAFRYDHRSELKDEGRRIVMVDRYRSLADHVQPDELPDYMAKLKLTRDNLGLQVTWLPDAGEAGGGGFNWTLALLATVLLLLFTLFARAIYRHDPAGPSVAQDPALEGIRGWLVLPAIGVCITPLVIVVELLMGLDGYALAEWNALATPGGAGYHALWVPLLLFELTSSLALLVLSVLVLVMFFQRRRRAPLLYLVMLGGSAASALVSLGVLSLIPGAVYAITTQDWKDMVRGLVAAAIWTPYFLLSRRVRSTFIRARAAGAGPLPIPTSHPSRQ